IAFSAIVAGYESVVRLVHLQAPTHLGALAIAAIIGFAGNEFVAQYRIRVGTRMGSAALIADGQHARVDGLTSLAVLIGAAGAWLGIPVLDPLVGIAITLMILGIVRDSARAVFRRLLDGIEPETIVAIRSVTAQVSGVKGVNDVRARWAGHAVMVDLSIAVDDELNVRDAHAVAGEVEHALLHAIPHLRQVLVHVDPASRVGAGFHGHSSHHHSH
ncbi:MAG TPA: cation diffusion facilitator family transporter, partial [Limnochordia bacterium]|nr:cation diffusion facilitator family transporter [Limnochordia bacterium]